MTSKKWRETIKKNVEAVQIYKPSFDSVIATISDILEERDRIHDQYIKEGAQPLVVYTSDRGSTNSKKNPLLEMWDDLNKTALTYWRDLGLTPAGLKRIDEESMKPKKEDFSALISKIAK